MSNILILTASIGAGHISVARAIREALYRTTQPARTSPVHVEIIDIITKFKNIPATAMKKIYLGSLKLSPKIYELIFAQTAGKDWPLKLFNHLSAPFIYQKLLDVCIRKKPDILISTIPMWDLLVKQIWREYQAICGRGIALPFVSMVTDSISIHPSWTLGKPDYFIVANNDTRIALQNLGVASRRIKVLGYPVTERFLNHRGDEDFEAQWNLSPKKKTLLLILSTGLQWSKIKKLVKIMQKSLLPKMQLMIVACGDAKWKKKLAAIDWPLSTRITGWTKEMHACIHSADIVCTKAGGATVMECIASKKPMIIIDALPGQEIGNAMLVQKYNLGVVLSRDLHDFKDAIAYIISHEALIKKNLTAQQTSGAARATARFLLSLLPKARSS